MEGSGRFVDNHAVQDRLTGLCMECAIRHHRYEEILGYDADDDHFAETSLLQQAWIDGRRHVLMPDTWTGQTTCTDCARTAPTLYVPV